MRCFARSQEKLIIYLRVSVKYLSMSRKSITRLFFAVKAADRRLESSRGELAVFERESARAAAFATDDGKNVPQG